MIKLDFNTAILNLDDTEAKDTDESTVMMYKHVGNHLANFTDTDDPLKFYQFATDIYKNRAVEIDKSDYDKIYAFYKGNKKLPPVIRGQIMQQMDSCKEKSEKSDKKK